MPKSGHSIWLTLAECNIVVENTDKIFITAGLLLQEITFMEVLLNLGTIKSSIMTLTNLALARGLDISPKLFGKARSKLDLVLPPKMEKILL